MFATRSALTACVLISHQPVRVGVLLLRAVEVFHALGFLVAQAHAVQEPSDPLSTGTHVESALSHSRTRPLIVTALRHRTSDTRRMCSLSRVMSAGDSKVFLPSGASTGALRFQRYGVFWLIPSNILGHKRRTSPRHCGMHHCRSVLQWQDMSGNQSRRG